MAISTGTGAMGAPAGGAMSLGSAAGAGPTQGAPAGGMPPRPSPAMAGGPPGAAQSGAPGQMSIRQLVNMLKIPGGVDAPASEFVRAVQQKAATGGMGKPPAMARPTPPVGGATPSPVRPPAGPTPSAQPSPVAGGGMGAGQGGDRLNTLLKALPGR